MKIRNVAAALACLSIGAAQALKAQDVSKVGDFAGVAADLNNAGQVLLTVGTTGFIVRNPITGASQSVTLDATLAAQGFTTLVARDLNNVGQVTGFLNDTTPFLWSPGKGVQVLPVGFGGRFVNDAGTTLGPQGTWSESTGSVSLPILGSISSFNNAGQVSAINSWIPIAGNPGGSAVVTVLSPSGAVLFQRVYSGLTGSLGPSQADSQITPDAALLNDQGQLALAYVGVQAWGAFTDVYSSFGAQPTSETVAALSLNNKGELLGYPSFNAAFPQEPAPYLFTGTERAVSLNAVTGLARATVINDKGWILQPKDTTYSLYRYAPGSYVPVPMGTGTGLLGQYSNTGLLGSKVVLSRIENPSFDWGKGRPAPGVNSDFFSVKWAGQVEAEDAGVYHLRTVSDEGVRVTVDGTVVIDNWRAHKEASNDSTDLTFERASRHTITIAYFELLGNAKLQLTWQKPGSAVFEPVPTSRLYQP
jgi:hypothetical protein